MEIILKFLDEGIILDYQNEELVGLTVLDASQR